MRKSVHVACIALLLVAMIPVTAAFAQNVSTLIAELNGGGWVGISISDLTKARVTELKLPDLNGVLIDRVEKDSPGEKAGLQPRDVIVQFNGIKVLTVRQFTRMVNELLPDRTASVVVMRQGAQKSMAVTLGNRPKPDVQSYPRMDGQALGRLNIEPFRQNLEQWRERMQTPDGPMAFWMEPPQERLGITLDSLTPQLGDYFGVQEGHGALVISVRKGSAADKAGLKAGDVIVSIDSKDVRTPSDVIRIVREKSDGNVDIRALRDRQPKSFNAELEKRDSGPNIFHPRIMAQSRSIGAMASII